MTPLPSASIQAMVRLFSPYDMELSPSPLQCVHWWHDVAHGPQRTIDRRLECSSRPPHMIYMPVSDARGKREGYANHSIGQRRARGSPRPSCRGYPLEATAEARILSPRFSFHPNTSHLRAITWGHPSSWERKSGRETAPEEWNSLGDRISVGDSKEHACRRRCGFSRKTRRPEAIRHRSSHLVQPDAHRQEPSADHVGTQT